MAQRRIVVAVAIVLALLLPATALAQIESTFGDVYSLSAQLRPDTEIPPGDPDGFGFARITIFLNTGQLCFNLSVARVEPATAAHIHEAPFGVAGPVVVPLAAPSPEGLVKGCVSVEASLLAEILAAPWEYYVNVHNADYPAGVLRGQLDPINFTPPLIEEPTPPVGDVETIIQFNAAAGELPEGVTVDQVGNVYISLSPLGQLMKLRPGSTSVELFGVIPGLLPDDFGLLGLAVDALGNVYGTVVSANPAAHGVWRFDGTTGVAERVPGTEAIALPNAIAFDERGTMYITDTVLGAVWRVPQDGALEQWIVDPLLAGDGSAGFGFPIGANGIAVWDQTVYVGVSETGLLVTIPILPDGSAGPAQLYQQLSGVAIDGIALDVHGNVYIADVLANAVVRVKTDGSVEVLATAADGLDAPSSLAFGTGEGDRYSLYVVNFSVALAPPGGAGPALLRLTVDEPGLPLP